MFSIGCVKAAGFSNKIVDEQGWTGSLVHDPYMHVDYGDFQPGDWIFGNGPDGVNSHMWVATSHSNGVSHGHIGFPNFVTNTYMPFYAARRVVH